MTGSPSPTIADEPRAGAYTPDTGRVDARPILPRNASNIWESTEQLRSELARRFEDACRTQGIDALVLESPPYVHPAWVKFESWMPEAEDGVTKRSSLLVTITAMPYHRFNAIYRAEWELAGRKRSIDQLHQFGAEKVDAIVEFLCTGSGRNPRRLLRSVQLRQNAVQLWKPRNKVAALGRDWLKIASVATLIVAGLMYVAATEPPPTGPVADLVVPEPGVTPFDPVTVPTIVPGDAVRGAVGPRSQAAVAGDGRGDHYYLAVQGATPVSLRLESGDFDAILFLLDEYGTQVLALSDDSGDGTDSQIDTTLASGTYLLLARGLAGVESGEYVLRAAVQGQPTSEPVARTYAEQPLTDVMQGISAEAVQPTPWTSWLERTLGDSPLTHWQMIGLLVLLGVAGLIVCARAPRLVRSAGKPMAEPRVLRYLDAWQTVVFGAGHDADELKRRLMSLLTAPHQQRFGCRTERIWHWGLEGKEEREQIVLRFGRSLVFCQVYPYGSDLYVGWDAHVNAGTWKEKLLAAGVDRTVHKRVHLMTVEHAVQPITEYDLADVNCLAEWTHAQITQVLKHYVKERTIDQEIDFTIIRGERQGMTANDEEKKKPRFRRTA